MTSFLALPSSQNKYFDYKISKSNDPEGINAFDSDDHMLFFFLLGILWFQISLFFDLYCSTQSCTGEAGLGKGTRRGWTELSAELVPLLDGAWTLWRRFRSRGLWPGSEPSWRTPAIPCTQPSPSRGACLVADCGHWAPPPEGLAPLLCPAPSGVTMNI